MINKDRHIIILIIIIFIIIIIRKNVLPKENNKYLNVSEFKVSVYSDY